MFYSLFYGKALHQIIWCECVTGFQCQCTNVKRFPGIKFPCQDTHVNFLNIEISMSWHMHNIFLAFKLKCPATNVPFP